MAHPLAPMALAALVVIPQATPPPTGSPSLMATQIAREEARTRYRAGEALMLEEAYEEAAKEFRTAVRLDPAFALAHYSLGRTLMVLRRYSEALSAFTDARDVLTRQSHLDQKGRAEFERERSDEIHELEESLQRVYSGKIKDEMTLRLEVGIEDRLRVLHEAEQRGVENRVRVPAELSLALGSAYFRLDQLEPAEKNYRAAIRAKGSLGAAHNNLAVIYMMTGRFDEARREIVAAEEAGFTVSLQFKKDLETWEARAEE